MFEQLVAGHSHVANGLLGYDILAEDSHLDLVIGRAVVLPQSETLLAGVVQQADGVSRPAAVIKVSDYIDLHVVVARLCEVDLVMPLRHNKMKY